MAIRTIGATVTDSEDTLGLSPVQVQKFLAVTDKFGTTINGGLVQTVLMLLREANSTTETAGISGLQGPLKDLPAFWGGGTYAQALAGTSKSLIRHDGFAKFEYGKIAAFDIVEHQLTTNGAGISGFKGEPGRNITGITTYYSSAEDSLYPPNIWRTIMPALKIGHYLWKYEKIGYTGGLSYNSKPVVIASPSTRFVKSAPTHYYLVSNSSTGVKTTTPGWQTGTSLTVTEGQYLWSYTSLPHSGSFPDTIAGPFNISPVKPAFWAGGGYGDAVNGDAKAIIRHDGSVKFTDADIEGRINVLQSDGSRVLLDGSGLSVFNAFGNMNIRFGLKDGYAVMEYYDNDGTFLYDLGPNGLTTLQVRAEGWAPVKLVYLDTSFENALNNSTVRNIMRNNSQQTESTFQKYIAKMVGGVKVDTGNNDGKLFKSDSLTSGFVNNGIYMRKTGLINVSYTTSESGIRLYPPGIQAANEAVYDTAPLYLVQMIQYLNGVVKATANAYWNG